ncbi:hypothetical protein VKT23_014236 [Stygiomarasmius scandens]|uniref:Uncharacterized protein n=1 Tax=Marasmiellus scandens TaxID=2682957 RepID=A0ABR1J140_9AGAR
MVVPACFVPSEPVLDYLLRFYHTHPQSHLGVDQILNNLCKNPSKSPKAAAFLDLCHLCPTGPPRTSDRDSGRLRYHFTMSTDHFPPLQILNDNYQFVDAEPFVSNNISSYRIYDATNLVPEDPSFSVGVIPLFRDDIPEYKQQYWRLNRPLGLVLGFIHTHLIQQQYSLPTGSYQPPIECVKTRMVICMIEDRVFSAQTPVNISLVDIPLVTAGSADLDGGYIKVDCTEVSVSDDMQTPSLCTPKANELFDASHMKNFLSSLKDLDLEEPKTPVPTLSQLSNCRN